MISSLKTIRRLILLILLTIVAASSFVTVNAQPSEGVGGTAIAAEPERYRPTWQANPPAMDTDLVEQLEIAKEGTHLPGPLVAQVTAASDAGATEGTEALPNSDIALADAITPQPSANSDAVVFKNNTAILAQLPTGNNSSVMESTVGQGGRYVFYAGNWFAARSTNGGSTWRYVNPFADYATFCCDQVAIYDNARDMHLWYRQASRAANGTNTFRLGTSVNGAASFCNYTFAPTNLDSTWTGQWFDYPHLQVGADYLYIATNVFAGNSWVRTLMIRFPLDALRDCAGFNYDYYWNTNWFTFVPAQGAEHIMYFASNWPVSGTQNNRVILFKWPESTGFSGITSVQRTVATFNTSGANLCGASAGNWLSRNDFRLKAVARYEINNTNLSFPGRKILGLWWGSGAGGNFPQPYIEGAAFFEDTLTQVPGNAGRPLVWNATQCFAYPSAAANERGDLAISFNVGSGTTQNPSFAFALSDDYTTAVPAWTYFYIKISNARPADSRWGDYNTTRAFNPSQRVWVTAGHYNLGAVSNIPIYAVYGRERDRRSFTRWDNR